LRGALAGGFGGVAAGVLDFALAAGRASAFLPDGRGRLLLFLVGLYGAAGALAGLALGLAGAALGWATDLGPLWRHAFDGPHAEARKRGAPLGAYVTAVIAALVALGFATRALTLDALGRYHHRMLIAALVGASTAGVALGLALAVFAVAAMLARVVRIGPRLRLTQPTPIAVLTAGWTLGLFLAAGTVAYLVMHLEARPRMTAPMRALNAGMWAPLAVLGSLVVGHFLGRGAWRIIGRREPARAKRLLSSPGACALAIFACLASAVGAWAAMSWATVRQLDLRPFFAVGFGVVAGVGSAVIGSSAWLQRLRPIVRAALAIGLPVLLLAMALVAGRSERVRKSATAFTGLSAPLQRALQRATDLDGDGFSSVLGGGDCNDLDRDVHPGAFDWPDDGIDQDCNGHEATLKRAAAPRFADVPATVPTDLNVVLITVDALRADHVGSYGYARPTTPNLDQLAHESVRFANAWSHAPSTRYSVPAILAGRYPSTIAVNPDPRVHWPPQVLPDNRMIAEMLKDRGYRTGAMLSYHYFEPGWGLNQGFDEYDYHLYPLHSVGGDPAATSGSSARQLADLDVAFIEKHAKDKFFLWTHFYDTHFRFERHPDMPETDFGSDEIALYDGEIRFTDAHIGRVLEAIKKAGLWDKTIIIVTSDHGDGFGEHGLPPSQRHGYHLYRNETKVPLLIRVPGVQPRVAEDPVGHIDILPTVLNALRVPAGAERSLLGESVLDLMLGVRRPRAVFQEVWYEGPASPVNGTQRKAVVTHDWHLLRNLVPDDTTELYDETHDPGEEHDLDQTGQPSEEELRGLLAAWMDDSAIPPDFQERVAPNVSTTPMTSQRPLGDVLGGAVVIEGANLDTPSPKPGGPLEFSLILHATGRLPEGYTLFTHVIGAGGWRINADHHPLDNLYPLSRMKPGTWVRDKVRVQLPPGFPAGRAVVEVGLWKAPQRGPAHGPHTQGGAVRVLDFEIAR
jgi:arylsulfatase A-like enzyme